MSPPTKYILSVQTEARELPRAELARECATCHALVAQASMAAHELWHESQADAIWHREEH